jgi:hypothetical protein
MSYGMFFWAAAEKTGARPRAVKDGAAGKRNADNAQEER